MHNQDIVTGSFLDLLNMVSISPSMGFIKKNLLYILLFQFFFFNIEYL